MLKTEVGSYQHGIYNIGSRTRPEARRPPGVDRSARSRPLAAARLVRRGEGLTAAHTHRKF